MFSRYILALCLLAVSGCANRVSVDRTVYHVFSSGSNELVGKTFAIEYVEKPQGESLELTTHTQILTGYLTRYGMKDVSKEANAKPEYVVRVHYLINTQKKILSSSNPRYVTTGVATSYTKTVRGTDGPPVTREIVVAVPTNEYAGQNTSIYAYTDYICALVVTIHSSQKLSIGDNIPIYEGRVVSEGSSNDTTQLFPILISSLMYDFPSKSGMMDKDLKFDMK